MGYWITIGVSLAWLSIVMGYRLQGVPAARATKLGQIFFSLFLCAVHIVPTTWFLASLGLLAFRGIDDLHAKIRPDVGILPSILFVTAWFALVSANSVIMFVAVEICARKPWARKLLLSKLPIIYLVDSLTTYLSPTFRIEIMPHRPWFTFVFSQLLFAVLFGWIYVLMFRFYRSKRSDPIFANVLSSSSETEHEHEAI